MKKKCFVLFLSIALLLTIAPTVLSAAPEAIKVGVLLPLSGATASPGEYQLDGIKLCVDYINENGGIESMGGAAIELVISDTRGNVEVGMTEIERLITVQNISALIGPYNSTVGAATVPIAIRYRVPYVLINAIADNLLQNGPNKYVYRSNYGAADMAPFRRLVIDYLGSLTGNGKFSKIAIVYDAGDWGISENESFTKIAEEIGAQVVVSEAITTNSSDLSSVINKLKNSGAEIVFCGIFLNDAVLFARQMKEYNCDVQIVGSGAGFSDARWLDALGTDAAQYIMGTSDFNPSFGVPNEKAAALYKKYLSEYNIVMMPLETSNGWCGMATLIEAINAAASSEREAIADALYSMDLGENSLPLWYSMFEGVKFNTSGDALNRYNQNEKLGETAGQILKQLINGKWELVYPTENATAQIVFGK